MTRWSFARVRRPRLMAALLALLVGVGAGEVDRITTERGFRTALAERAEREAASLELETARGRIMGVASLLGLGEPLVKALVRGERSADDPEVLAALRPARRLLDADGVYAIDAKGIIVAHETDHKRSTGTDVTFRPYWRQAIAGKANVYAAVGSRSGKRGLYTAAPIRAGDSVDDPVIGVVLVKSLADGLDRQLAAVGRPALLASPQGVVFAATDADWRFHLVGPVSAERVADIGRLRQFGKAFAEGRVSGSLPFDPSGAEAQIDGRRFAAASAPVEWNDPNGVWSLVVLGDLQEAASWWRWAGVGGSVGGALFVLLVTFLRLRREAEQRRQAVAEAQAAAELLAAEAEAKSRQADFVLQVQRAKGFPAFVSALFGGLAERVRLHQGCLYYAVAGEGGETRLELAGSYVTEGAPERVALGEGLLGQCARDRRPLIFQHPPEGFWRVPTGAGTFPPRVLLLLPILRNDELLGVLELSSLSDELGRERQAVEELLPVLAMSLELRLAALRASSAA